MKSNMFMVIYLNKDKMSKYTIIAVLSPTKIVATLFKTLRGDAILYDAFSNRD